MNWKSFLYGIGVGMIGGYVASEFLANKAMITPEKALANAKSAFKEKGPITGSWINMTAEPYEKGVLKYKVFKGGITRSIEGVNEHFEFIADAVTGSILDVKKL